MAFVEQMERLLLDFHRRFDDLEKLLKSNGNENPEKFQQSASPAVGHDHSVVPTMVDWQEMRMKNGDEAPMATELIDLCSTGDDAKHAGNQESIEGSSSQVQMQDENLGPRIHTPWLHASHGKDSSGQRAEQSLSRTTISRMSGEESSSQMHGKKEIGCLELEDLAGFVRGLDRKPPIDPSLESGYVMIAYRDLSGVHVEMLPLKANKYEEVMREVERRNKSFHFGNIKGDAENDGDGSEFSGCPSVNLSVKFGVGNDPRDSCTTDAEIEKEIKSSVDPQEILLDASNPALETGGKSLNSDEICEVAEKKGVKYSLITGSGALLKRKSVMRITIGSQALDEFLGGEIETVNHRSIWRIPIRENSVGAYALHSHSASCK